MAIWTNAEEQVAVIYEPIVEGVDYTSVARIWFQQFLDDRDALGGFFDGTFAREWVGFKKMPAIPPHDPADPERPEHFRVTLHVRTRWFSAKLVSEKRGTYEQARALAGDWGFTRQQFDNFFGGPP